MAQPAKSKPTPGPASGARPDGDDKASSGGGKDVAKGGLYGSDLGANIVRASVAEFLGTFLLVLTGAGVAIGAATKPGIFDGLAIALAFGLMLAALATALGHVSGCHLNPAVTLSLAATRKFPIVYIPAYLAAQVGGAVLAALVLWAGYGDKARTATHLATPEPSAGLGFLRTGLIEAVITFLLVLIVISVATDDRVPAAAGGLAAGFGLFAAVAIGGPLTGGSVNPARALGPEIVSGHFPLWWVYLLAPVIGGVIAAVVYDQLLAKAEEPTA